MMRVLIGGAGPAGLSLANALVRKGVKCTVFEKAPDYFKSACFMLAPNGALAAKAIGILPALKPALNTARYQQILAPDGSVIATSDDVFEDVHRRFGLPFGLMTRYDFVRAAHSALPSDVVRFSSEVVGTTEESDGVRVMLADGSSHEGDVFISAEGVHSATRRALFDEPDYAWSGYFLYYGLTPAASLETSTTPAEETLTLLYGASGDHYALRFPLKSGDVYWAVYERRATAPPPDWKHGYHEQDKEALLAQIAHWKDPVIKALIGRASTLIRTEHWVPPDDYLRGSWHRGRVCLMGDAAHKVMPFTGQGTNMALDDALALARCLLTGTSVEAAFEEYHTTRYERTAAVRAASLQMGSIHLMQHPLKRALRNGALRLLGATGLYHRVAIRAAEGQALQGFEATKQEAELYAAAPGV